MWSVSVWFRLSLLAGVLAGTTVSLQADAPERRPTGDAPGNQVGEIAVNPVDGAEMVWVPAGEFLMGSEKGESNEKPAHRVRVTKGFWLYKTPVTNAQYGKFLAANAQHDKPDFWTETRFNQPQQPVVGVKWNDAAAYCGWARCRLSTEAQWEYAARGPKVSKYPWGAAAPDPRRAVFGQDLTTGKPASVGSCRLGMSWCGALDMVGNVTQWCADWYDARYYQASPISDPTGSANGRCRVFRGRAWFDAPDFLRVLARSWGTPDSPNNFLGFRPAQTASL